MAACRQCDSEFTVKKGTWGLYCSLRCVGLAKRVAQPVSSSGRPLVYVKDHPRADGHGLVFEHIVIVEVALGKFLVAPHLVHHFDLDKTNNKNANLVACEDEGYHRLLHARTRVLKSGGDPNKDKICSRCKRILPRTAFIKSRQAGDGLYRACKDCERMRTRLKARAFRETGNWSLKGRAR